MVRDGADAVWQIEMNSRAVGFPSALVQALPDLKAGRRRHTSPILFKTAGLLSICMQGWGVSVGFLW